MKNSKKIKFSKKLIDSLVPEAKRYTVYDTELSGFGIRVFPSGARSYIIQYRSGGGGRSNSLRRMTLGKVNEITLQQARAMGQDYLAAIRLGDDPLEEKAKQRAAYTITDLINLWEQETPISRRTGKPITPRVKSYTLGRLRAHIMPLLGKRKVSELSTQDVASMIAKVTIGKTAQDKPSQNKRGQIKVSGGEGAARKVASDLSMIMNFAIERGLAEHNPVSHAAKPQAGKRHDYLKVEEIAKLGKAFTALEKQGANPMGIAINRLLLLTGARPSEIEGLRWEEIDQEGKCLRLQNTKTGYSTRPLSQAALDIILSQPKTSSPFVFPSYSNTGHYTSSRDIWRKARELAGLPNKVRYHARHAVATLALSAGHDLASVAAIMGHASPRTTLSTYAHIVDETAQKTAEDVGNELAEAMGR